MKDELSKIISYITENIDVFIFAFLYTSFLHKDEIKEDYIKPYLLNKSILNDSILASNLEIEPPNFINIDSDYDLNSIKSIYKNEIIDFVNKIKEKYNINSIPLLYRNLDGINVKVDRDLKDKLLSGLYDYDEKTIYINRIDNLYSLTHELLHLSSTCRVGNTLYSGLSYIKEGSKYRSAKGLNEGYTEYLNNKLFNEDNEYTMSYYFLPSYAGIIESLIGEDNMSNYYFNCDLNSLINDLSVYTSLYYSKRIVNYLDYLQLTHSLNQKAIDSKNYNKIMNDLNLLLTLSYYNKLHKEDMISDAKMYNFISNLPSNNKKTDIFKKDFLENNFIDNKKLTLKK